MSQLREEKQSAVRSSTPSPEVRHLKALDGLRGIAILMVLLCHSFEGNLAGGRLAWIVGNLVQSGKFGVDLFFVLSGFLITGILIDTRSDAHYFKRFFARRALRILPLYYGVLLLLLVLTPFVHFAWQGLAPWLLLYIPNFRAVQYNGFQLHPGPVALFHFWTLAIEEQFYLVWPFVIFLLGGKHKRVLWFSLFGAGVVLALRMVMIHFGAQPLVLHTSLYTRADSLMIGGALAALYRSARWWPRTLAVAPVVFVLFGGIFLGFLIQGNFLPTRFIYWNQGFSYTVLALSFAGLLAWSLRPAGVVQMLLTRKWLRWLGKYSYGLYVLHVPIISLVDDRIRFAMQRHSYNKVLDMLVSGMAGLVITVVAAWISFEYFEKRFLRLKRHFNYTRVDDVRTSEQTMVENVSSASMPV